MLRRTFTQIAVAILSLGFFPRVGRARNVLKDIFSEDLAIFDKTDLIEVMYDSKLKTMAIAYGSILSDIRMYEGVLPREYIKYVQLLQRRYGGKLYVHRTPARKRKHRVNYEPSQLSPIKADPYVILNNDVHIDEWNKGPHYFRYFRPK